MELLNIQQASQELVAVGDSGSYVEFTVPSDVPPLWWYDGDQQRYWFNDTGITVSVVLAYVADCDWCITIRRS